MSESALVHARAIRKDYPDRRFLAHAIARDEFLCGVDWPRNARGEIASESERIRLGMPSPPAHVVFSPGALTGAQRNRRHVTCGECLAQLDRLKGGKDG